MISKCSNGWDKFKNTTEIIYKMTYFKKNEKILLHINLNSLFWWDFPGIPGYLAYLGSQCDHSHMGGSQEMSDFLRAPI